MPVGWYRPTRRTEPTSRVYSLPATFGAVPRSWYGRSAKAAMRRTRSTGSYTLSNIAPQPVQRDGSPSLIHPARQEPAIHRQQLSGHESRRLRGEEHRRADEILDVPEPAHRRSHEQLVSARCTIEQPRIERRSEDARQNRVDAHARARPLDRQRLRERRDRCLARRVRRDFVQGHNRRQRSDVDDPAVAALHHVTTEDPAGAERPGEVRVEDLGPARLVHVERRRARRYSRGVYKNVDVT